jgi:hypothetical protein
MDSLPTEPELLLKKTTDLLKQVIGSSAQVAEYSIGNQRHDYIVMRIGLRNPSLDLILKLAGPDASIPCPFEQIALFHHLVATQTTVFMPDVIAADSRCRTWPWRYLIRAAVAGYEWASIRAHLSAKEFADAQTQIGDAVAQIHAISFSVFGELAANGQVQEYETYLPALCQRAANTIRSQRLRDLFQSVVNENADIFADVGKPALCHEDLHGHNLLFRKVQQGWQLATILDFDKAWAGCPETDLARMDLWARMTSAHFWQAYRVRHIVSELYEIRKPIYQLLWCLEYARLTEKHLADTNRLCQMLGVPSIESFE